MKKSDKKQEYQADEKTKKYYTEASMDALLYWTNTTTQVAGASASISNLLDMLGTCIIELVPEEKIDEVEEVISDAIKTAFDQLRTKSSQVSVAHSDKDNMN